MLTFLLLSAQGQTMPSSDLGVGQSQFLLGLVSQSRGNLVSASLQKAKAKNQNIIVNNLAAVTTGDQSASPVNA
jgi:hypothetical protein